MTVPPILLLGEAWGENENRIQRAFVGSAGIELLRMLDEAGILTLSAYDRGNISQFYSTGRPALIDEIWEAHRDSVRRSNVFNIHPPGNDLAAFCGPKAGALAGYGPLVKGKGLIRAEFAGELERLGDEILDINPNVIVALGNTALWALTNQTGISKLRGTVCLSTHCVSDCKLLPTYHPAAILRQWENRPVTVLDLAKAGREAAFPEIRKPRREIWIEPSLEDIHKFFADYIYFDNVLGTSCPLLSVDIETSGRQITCIGFAPSIDRAIVIPFFDPRAKGRSYWPTAELESMVWAAIRRVLADRSIPKLFQNGLYDISFLWTEYGIPTFGAREDTMLASHAQQPESLKGLAFLGSVYTNETAWKSERKGTTTIKRDE